MRILVLLLGFLIAGVSCGRGEMPKQQAKSAATESFYSCPMHHEIKSDHPGECPICHMRLEKIAGKTSAAKTTQPGERKIKFYRHPMNPSVISKVPMKDEMGMDYIPVYEEGASGSLSNVPLRGPVVLSEAQFQLTGASLVKVEKRDLAVRIPASGRALSPSRVALQIPERDMAFVKTGQEVELTSPSQRDEILKGKVIGTDASFDPTTRTLRIDVQLLKAAPGLRAESSIEGTIKSASKAALAIPEKALMHSAFGSYVFVADRSRSLLVPRLVKVSAKDGEWIEILEGVEEGEVISSGPNFLLDSESRIQVSRD